MTICDFSDAEIEAVTSRLYKNMTMLEYGSGGSTLHFSKLVSRYISIEHLYGWYAKVNRGLKAEGAKNVDLNLVIPIYNRLALAGKDIEELNTKAGFNLFRQYIEFVRNFPGLIFDAVLMDGRCRKYCSYEILPYLNRNSLVFFHDFTNRSYYHEILDKYEIVDSVNTLAILKKK